MRKAAAPILSILIIAAIASLAMYAMGVLDGDGVAYVEGVKHAAGGFMYNGEMREGLFDGDGEIVMDDGSVYQGGFAEGRFSGHGAYYRDSDTDPDYWHYVGEFEEGKTNKGTFYFPEGLPVFLRRDQDGVTVGAEDWQYSGGFSEHGANGTGTYTLEDGSSYTGGFLNNLAHGEGEYTDSEGFLIYAGGFEGGYFNGRGVYRSPEGWTYEGGFSDGLFSGEGRVTDGSLIIEGTWDRGVQVR